MTAPEFSVIKTLACEAINRNRNERQKTVLLTYASRIIRNEITALRKESAVMLEKTQLTRQFTDTRAHLSSETEARTRELAESGQKKPVQSVRFIASV